MSLTHSEQAEHDKRLSNAVRLEWISVALLVVTIVLVGITTGQSQAMKAAWLEDSLSLLPPLAFLIAVRRSKKDPDREHPYGHHRSVGVGHLVAAVALFTMGSFLIYDSVTGLVKGERAPIGVMMLGGYAIWAGWVMIAVMVLVSIPPVILGHAKMKLAEPLHDKVLFADADMNKADWQSGLATCLGVLGIGIGWWWADGVAALIVSAGIVHDGFRNIKAAISGLTDVRARTYDDKAPHPLIQQAERVLHDVPWVREAVVRMRDMGHVFHVEVFVVPRSGEVVTVERLVEVRQQLERLDPKLADVVVSPVADLPGALLTVA